MADAKITALVNNTTIDDADLIVIVDNVAGIPVTEKRTWTNVKSFLKTYFDAIYAAVVHTHPVSALSDATANGRSLISSANYASMRALLDLEAGTDFYSISAADSAIATAVAGLYDHKGGYNASTNTPDLDTTPSGILKGDAYTVSAAGTFFAVALEAGDVLIADQDNPTLATHWTIVNRNIDSSAFATAAQGATADTAEQAANKSITLSTDQASNTKYPSVKSVYDWATGLFATISNLALKAPLASPTFTGTVSGITATMVGLENVDNTSNATERAATATLTNKQITLRTSSATSTATVTPDKTTYDQYILTAQAVALTIANPSTMAIGDIVAITVTDNATARAITFGTDYVGMGQALPTTTTISKSMEITLKKITATKVEVLWAEQQ